MFSKTKPSPNNNNTDQSTGKDMTTDTKFQTHEEAHPLELEDGITHINVGGRVKTELGQLLNPLAFSRFNHPVFGPFISMEGFWWYIQAHDDPQRDRFRYLAGMNAKHEGKKIRYHHLPNFQQIINEANFFKIEQNPRILQLVLESELPFQMYYIFRSNDPEAPKTGVVVRPQPGIWLVNGFEEIRAMFKEGRRPERPDYGDVLATL